MKSLLFSSAVAAMLLLSWVSAAGAETTTIDVRETAGVTLMSPRAQLLVTTWDRPQIRIDSVQPVLVQRTERQMTVESTGARPVTILAVRAQTPAGPIELPQEQFVVQMPPDGMTVDNTIIRGSGIIRLTVPQNLAFFAAVIQRGRARLQDLRTTFILKIGSGGAALDRVAGEGYVQVLEGPVLARDSNFTRLRTRTGTSDVVMERCHAKQIEVSSVNGSIVYDDGSFEPGLAHFESRGGNVAIGVSSGGAQIAGQTQGQIFTALERGSSANVRPHELNATVNGGGPYVSVASESGTLYVYNGSLQHNGSLIHRPNLPPEWERLDKTMHRYRTIEAPQPAPARIPNRF